MSGRRKYLKNFSKPIDKHNIILYNCIINKGTKRKGNEMENIIIFEKLVKHYTKNAYTDKYIFGFRFQKNIWSVNLSEKDLPYIMKLDKASRGQGMSLRYKPNKEQKAYMLNKGAKVLCSESAFEDMKKESKYNYGEIYEKIITEKNKQTWTKDNLSYTKGGDIEIKGTAYQIKFEKATFTNEKSAGLI